MNKPIPFETLEWLCKHLLSKEYRYARTMPQYPHFYTRRKDWASEAIFEKVVALIRTYGYEEKWHNRKFVRFDINEFQYWTMGDTLENTTVINRAYITRGSQYDDIALKYDDMFSDEDSIAENKLLAAIIPDLAGKAVLDIGCGTGLLAEIKQVDDYTGIDPSGIMLSRFRMKLPKFARNLFHSTFEAFYTEKRFDAIISLFGSPSYINPGHLQKVKDLLKPGGEFFLMFYNNGYIPVTYRESGVVMYPFENGINSIEGRNEKFGNFTISRGPV